MNRINSFHIRGHRSNRRMFSQLPWSVLSD